MADRFSEAVLELRTDKDDYERGLKDAEKTADSFGKRIEQRGKDLERFGFRTARAGQDLTMGFTLPLVGAAGAALKFSTDLNEGMANVSSLIPGNRARVEELKREVQELAIETGKGTRDMSDGLYLTVSAFGDSADTAERLRINARAAVGGVAATSEAIALTSAVTKAYGDTSAEAVQKAADLGLLTTRLGQTTFPELSSAIGLVASDAASLKVSQEELSATFATLTGVTGNANRVATQYRAILVGLQNPSTQMQAALEGIGFETGEAAVETLGLKGTLDGLLQQQNGNINSTKKLWGQTEAWGAVAALAGQQSETFETKLAAMEDRLGTTDEAFREQTEGVNEAGFQWEQTKQRMVVAAQRMGDRLAPALVEIGSNLAPLLGMVEKGVALFASLPEPVQTGAVALGLLAAGTGPAMIGIGKVAQATGTMLTGLGKVPGALSKVRSGATLVMGVLTPPGLLFLMGAGMAAALAIGIAKLITARQELKRYREEAKKAANEQRDWKDSAKDVLDVFRDLREEGWEAQRDAVLEYLRAAKPTREQAMEISKGLQLLKKEMPIPEYEDLQIVVRQYIEEADLVPDRNEDVAGSMDDVGDAAGDAKQPVDALAKALETLGIKAETDAGKKLDALFLVATQGNVPVQQLEAKWKSLFAELVEGGRATEEQRQKLGLLATIITALGGELDEATLREQGFTDALVNMIEWQPNLEGFWEAYRAHIDATIASLHRMEQAQIDADQWIVSPPSPESIPHSESLLESLFGGKSPFGQGVTNTIGGLLSGDSMIDSVENGLSIGLSMGMNAIIPGLGTLAQPLVSALSNLIGGLFGGPSGAERVARDFGKFLGIQISEGLAESLAKRFTEDGKNNMIAAFRGLPEIMAEIGSLSGQQLSAFLDQGVKSLLIGLQEGKIRADEFVDAFKTSIPILLQQMKALADQGVAPTNQQVEDLNTALNGMLVRVEQGYLSTAQAQEILEASFPDLMAVIGQMGDRGNEVLAELMDRADKLGIEIDFVAEASSQAKTAFEEWKEASATLSSLRQQMADLKADWKSTAVDGATATREWMNDLGARTDVSFKSVREKWQALGERMGWTAQQINQAVTRELTSMTTEAAAGFREYGREVMQLTGPALEEFVQGSMERWRGEVRATEREQKRAAREAFLEQKRELRRQILEARQVELAKRKVARETLRTLKLLNAEMAEDWAARMKEILQAARDLREDLVGNSEFPDMVDDIEAVFGRMETGWGSRLDTMAAAAGSRFRTPVEEILEGLEDSTDSRWEGMAIGWSSSLDRMLRDAEGFHRNIVGASIIPDLVSDVGGEWMRMRADFSGELGGMLGDADRFRLGVVPRLDMDAFEDRYLRMPDVTPSGSSLSVEADSGSDLASRVARAIEDRGGWPDGGELRIEIPVMLDGREIDRRTVRVTKDALAERRIPVPSDAIVQR